VSIVAEFVAVSSSELAAIIDDPSSAMPLFVSPVQGSFDGLLSKTSLDRLDRLSPESLAAALPGLDAPQQQELAQRLASLREVLGTEEGRAALLGALHGPRSTAPSDAESDNSSAPRRALSLDKAWQGAHFLLTGESETVSEGVGSVILGGTEIGEDEGYGPVRYFTAQDVTELSAALDRDGLDTDVEARFDADRMSELGIYPGGWDNAARSWLLDAVRDLRAFFRDAAAQGEAIVTYLT
jgi:hypothetical protein